jgi:hypothetical protein
MMLLHMADVLNDCVNADFTEYNSDYNDYTWIYVWAAFSAAQVGSEPDAVSCV